MNNKASSNLLQTWDQLCTIIDKKGSVVQTDTNNKSSDHITFNQIKLNRNSVLWQSILQVLEPLSIEETEVLIDLSKTNDTHAVYQLKVSLALLVSIPLGLLTILNFVIDHLNTSGNLSAPIIGGLIGGGVVIVILGGFFLYKQLSYRWLSMELTTCLETALAMKKAEHIDFKQY